MESSDSHERETDTTEKQIGCTGNSDSHGRETEATGKQTGYSENASDRESSIESFHTNKSELSITTETELIDVEEIELSDEESWLYKSPKKMPLEEKSVCTQKWIQKSFEDVDDMELNATRSALLNKLNQLKLLNSSIEQKSANKDTKALNSCDNTEEIINKNPVASCSSVCVDKKDVEPVTKSSAPGKSPSPPKLVGDSISSNGKIESKAEITNLKNNQVFDVMDVQKIARLQEESLKQSTYKFLNQAGKKTPGSRDLSPVLPAQVTGLNKPASVEALNTCSNKVNQSNMYSMVPLQGMKKQSLFSSSSTLNCSQDFHRGSLPNINKGYYSLKTKKSKRPSEPKVSCPLPIYPTHPKVSLNGTAPHAASMCDFQNKSQSLSYDHREARTLPSSYRVHSRSHTSSRRDLNARSSSPRRESMPFVGSNLSVEPNHRDNYRKYSSPVPTTVYPRYNSSANISPTKVFDPQSQNQRSQSVDYYRAASHSPARRLPLQTVQHQSPKKGSSVASLRNGEIRTFPPKIPSKIPSPALKSGIPVPSTYGSRSNEEDTWSQDCF